MNKLVKSSIAWLFAGLLLGAAGNFLISKSISAAYEFHEAPVSSKPEMKAMWKVDRKTGEAWVALREESQKEKLLFWYKVKEQNEATQIIKEWDRPAQIHETP